MVKAVSVYSPAWPIDRERLARVDVAGVRLEQNPDVWLTDILWAALRNREPDPLDLWIVAGDLNLSETFDDWPGGPRGNRVWLDRMAEVGLVDCLRKAQGKLTPTFRNTRRGAVRHQMDHMFASERLISTLVSCETGSQERVFGGGLSDHLPLVAVFQLPPEFASSAAAG
jgi:endonuclease/exonuclease/phosphatase family metal-dependent hydrolase